MQTQQATNGSNQAPPHPSVKNGVSNGTSNGHDHVYSQSNEDIVRIIGQHLTSMGLTKSVSTLMEESGCRMDHPVASRFRDHVMEGDWTNANIDLQQLKGLLEWPESLVEMQFHLLEQKYLEQLEEGNVIEALSTLRHELTPLNHKTARVHQLSGYIMCATGDQVREQAGWRGKESRVDLMEVLQQFLPASVMLPNDLLPKPTTAVWIVHAKRSSAFFVFSIDFQICVSE